MGENVDGVRDDEEDALEFGLLDLTDDAAHDGGVLLDEVEAGLAGLLGGAGGDDDDIGVRAFFIGARMDVHGIGVGETMGNVHGFAFGLREVGVDEDDFGERALEHEGVGGAGTDEPGSDDDGFSAIDHIVDYLLASSLYMGTRQPTKKVIKTISFCVPYRRVIRKKV